MALHKYLVIIGGREMEIGAPNVAAAQDMALRQYPGQQITGTQYLGEIEEAEPEEETEPDE